MEWKCIDGCDAECCGMAPMPISTYNIFKRKIKKRIIDIMKLRGHIVLMTEDASCAFLDSKRKCSIYEHRPKICKSYGVIEELQCPYIDINGNRRIDQEVIATKELIKLQNKIRIDMLKQG